MDLVVNLLQSVVLVRPLDGRTLVRVIDFQRVRFVEVERLIVNYSLARRVLQHHMHRVGVQHQIVIAPGIYVATDHKGLEVVHGFWLVE